jgi:hypothetical protein
MTEEQARPGDFAKGEDDPKDYPEDKDVGRFSKGQEELSGDDPEKHEKGRFSEGQEDSPNDPEKDRVGTFDEEE